MRSQGNVQPLLDAKYRDYHEHDTHNMPSHVLSSANMLLTTLGAYIGFDVFELL